MLIYGSFLILFPFFLLFILLPPLRLPFSGYTQSIVGCCNPCCRDLPEDANPVTEAEIEKVVGMDENSDIDDSNIEVDPFSDIPVEEDVQMTSEDRGGMRG